MKFKFEPLQVSEIQGYTLVIYKWENLSKHTQPKPWENVELFDKNGKKIWTVNGMDNSKYWSKEKDTFVSYRTHAGKTILQSFSGNSFKLNLENGKVEFKEFTK